jgi:Flp pilus assembly protein TadB
MIRCMQPEQEPPQLGSGEHKPPSLLARILAVVASVAVLIGAVAVSFVLFVVALTVIATLVIYVWWKTRHLRRQLRTRPPPGGTVIEGEVNWREDVDETKAKKNPRA